MILILSNNDSPRLRYICQFIFNEQLGIEYRILTGAVETVAGYKIEYREQRPADPDTFHIIPHSLLFETGIRQQRVECRKPNAVPVFFQTPGADLEFDIFAACFYLLSRYEEYLPFEKDEYGRFGHASSLAFRENFLDKPLVNIWIQDLAGKLRKKFPGIAFNKPSFRFLPTYDIDIAFQYKHKGFFRSLRGLVRNPTVKQLSVMLGSGKDPFDIYDELDALHETHSLHPVYFFLAAEKRGRYDKNNPIQSHAMKSLIKKHAARYSIGIHPSWKSNEDPNALALEKAYIEDLCGDEINNSRQHYIKFELPATYRHLVSRGILNEFSMGYGSINGFRASVCSSFFWYDLRNEKETALRIHPFCYMDANCYFEEKLGPDEALEELSYYHDACRSVNGTLITIFHNMFMADNSTFRPWKENYFRFIAQMEP